jgi:drug/metabolite transporter (DMT)-like permease
MRSSASIVIPLCSAVGYTFAAMALKRAMDGGHPWRVLFIVNLIGAVLFQTWLLHGGEPFTATNITHAVLAGTAFFIGQVFTFIAISRGDISIATPVLGTKVVFVALLVFLTGGEELGWKLWVATFLTTLALALLGGEWRANRERLLVSVGFAFLASIAFAATDVMQQLWVPAFGFGHFGPVMFLTVGALSFALIPFFSAPLSQMPRSMVVWAFGGGLLLTIQAMGIAYCIAVYHEVTVTNVLYNTRGLWSVALVWIVGHWFSNSEKHVGRSIMTRRLIGALILLAAVYLSLA